MYFYKQKLHDMRLCWLIAFFIGSFMATSAMEVQLSHAVFHGKNKQAYTEIYMWIPAWNLLPKEQSNKNLQVNIELTLLLKKDSNNITYDKFNLNSRNLKDSNDLNFAIVDLKRYELKPGKYSVQLQAKDLNNPSDLAE